MLIWLYFLLLRMFFPYTAHWLFASFPSAKFNIWGMFPWLKPSNWRLSYFPVRTNERLNEIKRASRLSLTCERVGKIERAPRILAPPSYIIHSGTHPLLPSCDTLLSSHYSSRDSLSFACYLVRLKRRECRQNWESAPILSHVTTAHPCIIHIIINWDVPAFLLSAFLIRFVSKLAPIYIILIT